MAELGAYEVGYDQHLGHTLSIQCAFGRIEASIAGDAGIYDEIEIDLVTKDGKRLQLACVGCTENDAGIEKFGGEPEMHAYVWDGLHEDVAWSHVITVNDESRWW